MSGREHVGVWTRAALIYLVGSFVPVLGSIQLTLVFYALDRDPRLQGHLVRALRIQVVCLGLVFLLQAVLLGLAVSAPAVVREDRPWIIDAAVSALILLSAGPLGLVDLWRTGLGSRPSAPPTPVSRPPRGVGDPTRPSGSG